LTEQKNVYKSIDFGSGYNWNAAKLILAEVQKEHGMAAFDQLFKEMDM